jgi:speckle-type POZ protein
MATPAEPYASAVVGDTVTGHHILHVDCYSRTKEELPSGQCIRSCQFTVAGRSWHISYYPNGDVSTTADFASIYINLARDAVVDDAPINARARFALLDQSGQPEPNQTETTKLHESAANGGGYGFRDIICKAWPEKSKYLKDDRLTIRCDVFVSTELRMVKRRAASSSPPSVVVPPSDLHRHLGDLLATREGADVTFHVAGETFEAHRCVLAARSAVFKAELLGAMKESRDGAVIRVDDMDAQVFRALLAFVYTDTLPQDCFDTNDDREGAAMAQHLLVAADRYGMERLKLVCEDKLCSQIDTDSAACILALAEQHHCHGLKEACFSFLSSPSTLSAVMATDGFDHLTRSCPFVLKELMMSNLAAQHVPADFKEAK